MFPFLDLSPDAARWESHLPASRFEISSRVLSPHADLVRIEGEREGPRHLIAPPVSGHAGTLMLDLVLGLLATGPVEIIEMRDSDSRANGGPESGLHDQCSAIQQALASGPPAHLIGACQSTAATLSAAGRAPDALGRLTLIAAPISDVDRETGVAGQIPGSSGDALASFLSEINGLTRCDTAGRMVLPGEMQLAAILAGKGGASRVLFEESCTLWSPAISPARRSRAQSRVRILSRSQPIDRQLLLEALEQNFVARAYRPALGKLSCPVHLVAGENDTVIPAGQVFGGADLFSASVVSRILVPGADHFDLFCGEAAMQLGHEIGEFSFSQEKKATD